MGHEAYNGEDDKASKHAGAGVDAAHDDGVPEEEGTQWTVTMKEEKEISKRMYEACDCMFLLVYVVVVGVVAPQCDERAQAQSVGEEDLSCSIQPHL